MINFWVNALKYRRSYADFAIISIEKLVNMILENLLS